MNLPRSRRCKAEGCYVRFKPTRPEHVACGVECVESLRITLREKQRAKAEQAKRKEQREKVRSTKAAKESIKRLPELKAEAQREFNRYIRLRDVGLPCVCCGVAFSDVGIGGSADAGHYRSVGSAPHLRFHEDNVHAQRKRCNKFGAGRAVDYRVGLIARIGLARVEALEADNTPRHYTHDELRSIRDTYRARANQLKKEQA